MRHRPPDPLTVLVTGVGAPVAVSIFKALRQSPLAPRIVATDADPVSVGLFRADSAYVLPRITDDEQSYLDRLAAICRAEKVAMVCFGSEIEMRRVAPHLVDFERETGTRLILNGPRYLEPFMDKWETVCLLREAGLPVPDSVLASNVDDLRELVQRHPYPLIMKPRHSSGSKNVFVVKTDRELELAAGYVDDAVLQEYLSPDDEEYTVGIYKSARTGYVGQIVMRRTLSAGLTYKAEVVRDREIEWACRRVVDAFDVWGPINVQLRKTEAGVRIFEINLRFSSSAVMRAYFGFNEPEMCLRDVVLGDAISEPNVRLGYALRYWDEIYLAASDVTANLDRSNGKRPFGDKCDDF